MSTFSISATLCGPAQWCHDTPITPRPNTTEHSGNSSRSANNASSSSFVEKIEAMSASLMPSLAKIGLSSTVEVVVSKFENQENSESNEAPKLENSSFVTKFGVI